MEENCKGVVSVTSQSNVLKLTLSNFMLRKVHHEKSCYVSRISKPLILHSKARRPDTCERGTRNEVAVALYINREQV